MLVAADGPLILFTFQNKDSDMNDLLLSRQALFYINHEEARSQHQYFVLFHAESCGLSDTSMLGSSQTFPGCYLLVSTSELVG